MSPVASNMDAQPDPEIDRSPIWAMVYGRYLYLLSREMYWPDLEARHAFRIGVVGWPELAEDLGSRLDGRAIAGLPVDLIALSADELGGTKQDFTLLFVGDPDEPGGEGALSEALSKWQRKSNAQALVVTDGAGMGGHDLMMKRRNEGDKLGLCLIQDPQLLDAKGLALPTMFLQRLCP